MRIAVVAPSNTLARHVPDRVLALAGDDLWIVHPGGTRRRLDLPHTAVPQR